MINKSLTSLTFKISMFIITIMVISLTIFSLVFISSERNKLVQDIVKNGQIFASFSTQTIYDNYVQYYSHPRPEDFETFKTNISTLLGNNVDISKINLISINGKILFDSDEFKTGKYTGDGRYVTDQQTLKILAVGKVSYRNILEGDKEFTEIIMPIDEIAGHLFSVRYLLSNTSLSTRMNEVYIQIYSVVIPLILIAILLTLFFTIRLVKPISILTKNAQEISRGNLDVKVDIKSKDEIGQLAKTFNEMTVKIKDSYVVLESKVKERTADLDIKIEELAENNAQLGDSKKAITNLLEDIEIEKSKIEETVKIRTKELAEEKSRLLASINSLSFGFIIADMNSKVILSNPSILSILNTDKQPATIADVDALFTNFDLVNSCKECLLTQKVVEIKEILFSKKFLRVFCAPVLSENTPIGHVIIIEDITEAKVMERSKDEFFAVASHELRTPLTAIRGNSDMILEMYSDKIPNQDMKEMLTDINSASIRLIKIVNDFLEVSRLEQGKVETNNKTFDITELVDKTVKDLKVMADKKKISLTYNMSSTSLPNVFADQGHVEQILLNLIGNGIKFTDQGSVIIDTSLENNFIAIRITDTGMGIGDKNQSLLFRKFQQAGETFLARKDTNSTGLGLYISKLLVSNMGGDIKLEKSSVGSGSTFVFTLPIAV